MNDAHLQRNLKLIYNVTRIPVSVLDGEGKVLFSFPELSFEATSNYSRAIVLADFRAQGRDAWHPLISYLEPGFFLGVMELSTDRYLLIGLVSHLRHAREALLPMLAEVTQPEHMQAFCDYLLQLPTVSLDQVTDLIYLLAGQLQGLDLPQGNIRFVDVIPAAPEESAQLGQQLFEQREAAEAHIAIDFEAAFCSAVEQGNRAQLERRLMTPASGRVGRMSADDLQQEKYSFIALATLASRAAIRGGLPAETALSLSDLYCQRADRARGIGNIQELSYRMLTEYCDRVREIRKNPAVTPVIRKALSYISVHLHEPLGLEELSRVCGLPARSLSQRFKAELGMCVGNYIHKEKMQEAEHLLRYTDFSLARITAYLNYSSQSYFTRIFRETCGMTPQQYRERMKP